MEHRDAHLLFQRLFNFEALRRFDILEVDAAESRFQQFDYVDKFVGIVGVDFDVEHIDVGEAFEQHALAFHDGFAGGSTYIAQAQYGRAVTDHGDEIALRRILEDIVRILVNVAARFGHAGRVGQGEIFLGDARFGGGDLYLALSFSGMILQRFLTIDHVNQASVKGSINEIIYVVKRNFGCTLSIFEIKPRDEFALLFGYLLLGQSGHPLRPDV